MWLSGIRNFNLIFKSVNTTWKFILQLGQLFFELLSILIYFSEKSLAEIRNLWLVLSQFRSNTLSCIFSFHLNQGFFGPA